MLCRVWGQGASRDRRKKITGYMHRMQGSVEWRQKVKIHCTHNLLSSMSMKKTAEFSLPGQYVTFYTSLEEHKEGGGHWRLWYSQ